MILDCEVKAAVYSNFMCVYVHLCVRTCVCLYVSMHEISVNCKMVFKPLCDVFAWKFAWKSA